MTYLEIILWIQENLLEIQQGLNEVYEVLYLASDGMCCYQEGDSLISCVLKANGKELIV
jgi:hypothetical protein